MIYTLKNIRDDEHLAEMLALTVEWIVNDATQMQVVGRLVDEYQIPSDTATSIVRVAIQFLKAQVDIRE